MGTTEDGRPYSMAEVSSKKERYDAHPSNGDISSTGAQSLRTIIKNSQDDDNPVLVILTPKK